MGSPKVVVLSPTLLLPGYPRSTVPSKGLLLTRLVPLLSGGVRPLGQTRFHPSVLTPTTHVAPQRTGEDYAPVRRMFGRSKAPNSLPVQEGTRDHEGSSFRRVGGSRVSEEKEIQEFYLTFKEWGRKFRDGLDGGRTER